MENLCRTIRQCFGIQAASSGQTDWLLEMNPARMEAATVSPPVVSQASHTSLTKTLSPIFWVLLLMQVVALSGVDQRIDVDTRWRQLMKVSGFEDWPRMGTTTFDLCAPTIASLALLLFFLAENWYTSTRRVSVLRVLSNVLLVAAVVSWIFALHQIVTPIPVAGISDDTVTRLAAQSTAAASFNEGYCQAWCRRSSDGLVMLLRGDCEVTGPTAFDGIVGKLTVGEWCKEAIAKQSFELVADYSGVPPFACLKDEGSSITSVEWAFWCSIINAVLGFRLILFWIQIRGIIDASE